MARRKRKTSRIYAISLGAHLIVGGAIAMIPQEKLREVVAIALNEAPPPKDEPPPPPPPKPAPKSAERPARAARAPSAPVAEAAASSADSNAKAAAFTDLGLTLDSTSSDGIAVPIAPKPAPVAPAPVVAKPKVLVAKRTEPECLEKLVKPRPLALVRPSYTDDARRARVEGRLRIELAIDDKGGVTSARVLDGLGHGLDEVALAAARELRFSPATHCNRPVASPFVIAMRFVLGS